MKKISLIERLRYAFDNTVSRGPAGLIGWLAISTLVLIIIFTVLVIIGGMLPSEGDYPPEASAVEVAWVCLMRTIDSGTVADDTGSWWFRTSMLVLTFGGILIFSTLIGVLAAGIDSKLDELRKGRSRVIENNHTVILGWSPQIFTIISELVIANANQPSSAIVVLGNMDKVEMEDDIRSKVGPIGKTRLVCRTGKPIEMTDLELVSLDTARSIIVLSPDVFDPDSWVIKTLLAITNNPNRRKEKYHIVAEIHSAKNLEIVRMIGKGEIEILHGGDVVSRIMAQTCMQSGLSIVYMEVLNFKGDEIYFREDPKLVGKTFGEILSLYEDSSVMGIQPAGEKPHLNPPMDTEIKPGDRIIAISEDDDTVIMSGIENPEISEDLITNTDEIVESPEHILILGWNWRTPIVIEQLHHYFAPGSQITIMADLDENQLKKVINYPELLRENVELKQGDTTDRRTLDSLEILQYEYVIIMCYSDFLDVQAADARTLVTLLHLREIEDSAGHNFSIVSEMLDISNRHLAEVTRADDFVLSDSLISLMLTQLSENKALGDVYATLFDTAGSEIYLEPVGQYVKTSVEVNFYTVVEAARRKGQTAIGYRIGRYIFDASEAYGVVVNPKKSDKFTYTPGDKIITLIEK